MEGEKDRSHQAHARRGVVPAQVQVEIEGGEDGEDHQGDDFLDHLELNWAEAVRANPVGRHLQAILEEGNAPADENDLPQGLVAKSEVAVPGKGHEDVGEGEKNDGPHIAIRYDGDGLGF